MPIHLFCSFICFIFALFSLPCFFPYLFPYSLRNTFSLAFLFSLLFEPPLSKSCYYFNIFCLPLSIQGSTVTIKSPYEITYVCQNFDVRDVHGQTPKSIYQASYLLRSNFLNNFSEARSYLNRMKDC